jgi:hypothetical protein
VENSAKQAPVAPDSSQPSGSSFPQLIRFGNIAKRNKGDAVLFDQGAPMPDHQNRIMIYGLKTDGAYVASSSNG